MADVSLASLLAPLDAATAATAISVLQLVPTALATDVLQRIVQVQHGHAVASEAAANIVWKIATYLPQLTCGPRSLAPLQLPLKQLQLVCSLPVVRIHSQTRKCTCGGGFKDKKPTREALVANNATTHASTSNRFKVYSLAAGLLWADFVEQQCDSCKRCFLGHWSFLRRQAAFGHLSDLQCHDTAVDGFFVVPKYRSLFAVELALLGHLTDALHLCGGSMKAAVLLWTERHSERSQQDVLLGPDRTLLPHTLDNILLAWYVWRAVEMAGPQRHSLTWDLTPEGLDACLLEHTSLIRSRHLNKIADHIPSSSGRRAGTTGTVTFPGLDVDFYSGCTNFAHAKHQHCTACRTLPSHEHLIADQLSVLETQQREDLDGGGIETMYVVQCKDPSDSAAVVDLLLPRQEVRKDLLLQFERGLLPKKTDHGNKKARIAAKGPRQRARWLRKTLGPCHAAKPAACASREPAVRKRLASTQQPTECSVNKDNHRRRRTTGGILTCVLTCGLLADFVEMWRGENLDLVYVFLLQFYKDMLDRGIAIHLVGYDNACKLLKHVRDSKNFRPPWSTNFSNVAIVLDHFHKRNHTWCLRHLPEVNPDTQENAALLKNKNTEACEQLNSWISGRTRPSLEMPPGRFAIYWRTLFHEHNKLLEVEADCLRRRFARGNMKHDPDKPKHEKDARPCLNHCGHSSPTSGSQLAHHRPKHP